MKVLVVASYNKNRFAPFVQEQAKALVDLGCEVEFFGLKGKGLSGYLKNLPSLKRKIKAFHPDVVHAHYGLSGLLANLQRKVPVVTTYHGSDINERRVWRFSRVAMRLSAWNVFVSRGTLAKAQPKQHFVMQPCGVDLSDLQMTEKFAARKQMHLDEEKRYVLFSGAFDNVVKDASLAKGAVALLQNEAVELLELKGYSREEVVLLMCAADVLLMTSLTEGSPQVIKEALACGCPTVSVDVGDVKERIEGVQACYVSTSREPEELCGLLREAFAFEGKTNGRERIVADGLDNRQVAKKLMEIYTKLSQKA